MNKDHTRLWKIGISLKRYWKAVVCCATVLLWAFTFIPWAFIHTMGIYPRENPWLYPLIFIIGFLCMMIVAFIMKFTAFLKFCRGFFIAGAVGRFVPVLMVVATLSPASFHGLYLPSYWLAVLYFLALIVLSHLMVRFSVPKTAQKNLPTFNPE